MPLYRDPRSDLLVTQYSMKHVEQAGLVKFDFLGLTTLTILKRAEGLLAGLGITIDINSLPLDDAKTYEMLAKGDAGGVFQMEGQGVRDMLRQMKPDRFEDLVAAVALYRPGPMDSIPEYCRRKHAGIWEAPHPEIDDILAETYGIIVYQEQVMQIAQKMAGYSLGGADLLRRAMGKKNPAEMEAQRDIFTRGAIARGIDPEKATEIFELMAKFAGYGFNKCHAVPYGLLAYQTAWLKANHPEVFIAACMSLALGNTDRLAALKQEAERASLRILPPDVNRSAADFTVERLDDGALAIRYALAAVKKVGMAAMQAMVDARGDRPFADLADFAARVDPRQLNKMQLENLAKAGAFDRLEPNRARVFTGAETILRRAQAQAEETASGQIGLFGDAGKAEPLRLPEMPDWPMIERLAFEAEAIGFHLSAHPLDAYAQVLRRLGVTPCAQVEARARAGVTRVTPGRQCGCHQGTHRPQRQAHGLGAHLRRVRLHRGDAVRRDAGDRARPGQQRHQPAGDGGAAVPGRGVPHHRAGRGAARPGGGERGGGDAHLAAGNRGGAAHPRPAGPRGQGQGPGLPGAATRRTSSRSRSRCPAGSTCRPGWRRR